MKDRLVPFLIHSQLDVVQACYTKHMFNLVSKFGQDHDALTVK